MIFNKWLFVDSMTENCGIYNIMDAFFHSLKILSYAYELITWWISQTELLHTWINENLLSRPFESS